MKKYKKEYEETMPLDVQKTVLEFVKKHSDSTEVNTYQKSKSDIREFLSIAVESKLKRTESKEKNWSREKLSILYKWIDTHSWKTTNYQILIKDYQQTFKEPIPEWIKQILMRYVPDQSQKKKKTKKKASDKAKLLKLKKQIENMTDEKNIPDAEIIQDAGIIIGWILWKKCFDRFGWLDDGKFFEKDGIYTGLLCANWLTRLGESYDDTLSPLSIMICDLLIDECTYISDAELESHMKEETLEESIENYYTNLLLLWPIFKPDQQAEFKELFIQREGVVTSTFYGWNIAIVEEPYDVLKTRNPIPWPLTVIRFPWTIKTIDIAW